MAARRRSYSETENIALARARARVARAMEQLDDDRPALVPFIEHTVELHRSLVAYYRRLPSGKFGGCDHGAGDLYHAVKAVLLDVGQLGLQLRRLAGRIGTPPRLTEAALPPINPVPIDQWTAVSRRKWVLRIPSHAYHQRSWREIVDGMCIGGPFDERPKLTLQGPSSMFSGYLAWCEPVGRHLVAAWGSWDRCKALLVDVRSGVVRRCAEIAVPAELEGDERWVYARLASMRTAELAVLTLRERQAPRRRRTAKAKDGEAWLRRQLEGLGKEGAV